MFDMGQIHHTVNSPNLECVCTHMIKCMQVYVNAPYKVFGSSPQCQLQGNPAGGCLWGQHLVTAGGRHTRKPSVSCLLLLSFMLSNHATIFVLFHSSIHPSVKITDLFPTLSNTAHPVLSFLLHPVSTQRRTVLCVMNHRQNCFKKEATYQQIGIIKQWIDFNDLKFSMEIKKSISKSIHSKNSFFVITAK